MQLLRSLPILLRFDLLHARACVRVHMCARARGYNSATAYRLRGRNTLAFFRIRVGGEGEVLKVNCFLKVSPPPQRPWYIEIWTSFGARYCEQARPLFLSTCNYSRPGLSFANVYLNL